MANSEFDELSAAQKYALLDWYYENNGLYNATAQALYGVDTWQDGMKPLRNPAFRVVEFYVATVWPGALKTALPLVTENPRISAPILRVWEWSNWQSRKQEAVRGLAKLGDVFIKVSSAVASTPLAEGETPQTKRVYYQLLKPEYVTELDHDERGYLIYIRIDTPIDPDTNAGLTWRTEEWDKATQLYRVWRHKKGTDEAISKLGTPETQQNFGEFGIDFIPIVHAQFRSTGGARGECAFAHALDKIDEANLIASRLHETLFPPEVWALTRNGTDARDGRPLPPVKIGAINDDGIKTVEVGKRSMLPLPTGADIKTVVPDLPYGEQLAILNAHMLELEKDLPELAYYRVRDLGANISGRAAKTLLTDAIQRALEARGIAEDALMRANQMALTIGQAGQLPGFSEAEIGTYEKGAFEHSFKERDVIPQTEADRLENFKTAVDAQMPVTTAAREYLGWDDKKLQQMDADRLALAEAKPIELDAALTAAEKLFNQGK